MILIFILLCVSHRQLICGLGMPRVRSDFAVEMFHAMQRHGVVPDTVAYNALISACEKGKQADYAVEMSHAMQRHGAVLCIITYHTLISACEKGMQPN